MTEQDKELKKVYDELEKALDELLFKDDNSGEKTTDTQSPWETVMIPGDDALAKMLGVDRRTVFEWRKAGKITGKPVGIKKDGTPIFYSYNWERVKQEIKKNIRIDKRLEKMEKNIK